MYPLRYPQLPLPSVAHEWARELPQKPSEETVMSHLMNAIWRSELILRRPTTGEPITPEDLLKWVLLAQDHPGFTICERGETRSSSFTELPDGSAKIDFHPVILLPSDPARWTEEQQRAAIDVLSHCALSDFAEPFQIGVWSLDVTRDDFASYCRSAGFPLPPFWFGKQTVRPSLAGAERDCADWLRSLSKGPKQYPKGWYRDEAIRRFPGLSSNGFDRAWRRGTLKAWRKGGAPRKRKAS